MAYCTANDLRELGYTWDDATDLSNINQICDTVSKNIDTYCKQTFLAQSNFVENGEIYVRNGEFKYFPKNTTINNIDSISFKPINGHTIPFTLQNYEYEPDKTYIYGYTNAPDGRYRVTVTYDFGFINPIAGQSSYTISTNFISGDTINIQGQLFTATTGTTSNINFAVGNTTIATAQNIYNSLILNVFITNIYTVSVQNNILTLTETVAGGGNTPTAATTTGTGVITNGTAVTSTSGTIPDDLKKAAVLAAAPLLDDYFLSQNSNVSMVKSIKQGDLRIEREDTHVLPPNAITQLNGGNDGLGYVRVRATS